jgi:two-component system chemotaxis sensor kinase CheA
LQEVSSDPVQVVVFNDGDVSVGMMVDQILDVAEEAVTVRQKSDRKGLLGSAVVGTKVTDFLDLNEVLRAVEGSRSSFAAERANSKSILVLDASAFSRGIIRGSLDMAGYSVLEAESLAEAIRKLEQHSIDAVVATLDLQANGSSALIGTLRGRSEWERIPALALVDPEELADAPAARAAGFKDCQSKFDGMLVLASVARMISPLTSCKANPECVGEAR